MKKYTDAELDVIEEYKELPTLEMNIKTSNKEKKLNEVRNSRIEMILYLDKVLKNGKKENAEIVAKTYDYIIKNKTDAYWWMIECSDSMEPVSFCNSVYQIDILGKKVETRDGVIGYY